MPAPLITPDILDQDTEDPAARPGAELLAEIRALHSIIAALPVTERAKGTIMLSHGLTADAAFELLRRYSKASVRKSSPPPLLPAVCVARRARALTSTHRPAAAIQARSSTSKKWYGRGEARNPPGAAFETKEAPRVGMIVV